MRDAIKMDLLAIKIAELEIEKEQYKMLSEHYKQKESNQDYNDLPDVMFDTYQPAYHFYLYYLNQYEIVCSKLEHFKNELIKLNEG